MMELISNLVLIGLKFLQIPIISILVYLCYQIYVINDKQHYSYIFKGWGFNLIHIILLIPITFPILFNLSSIETFSLYTIAKFFDLLGGMFILLAVRDHISQSKWSFIKYIPHTNKTGQIYLGFLISFLFCFIFFINKYYYDYNYLNNMFSSLLLIPQTYTLSLSYFILYKYYQEYSKEKLNNKVKFLLYGAFVYSIIQLLPPVFELLRNVTDETLMEIIGYSLGLTSKMALIIGLHSYLVPELPDDKKIAENISKKKDLISEAFHEIEGMGDLIHESIEELTDKEYAYKYQINGKTKNVLDDIEKNNHRNIEILSSYRRLLANLTTGDYEKDTEKIMMNDTELNDDLNVNVIINMVCAIVKSKFPTKGIKIIKDLGGVDKIKCRQFEFYQIIKIILINAFEACPEKGRIWIKTNTKRINKNKWIQISISDNGIGISEENQDLIFEENFTTKPLNEETWKRGHGLPTALRILNSYGFKLNLISKENKGYLIKEKVTEFLISISK